MDAEKVLAKGLQAGFAGHNKYQTVTRGKFSLQSSEYSDSNDFYIDQYVAKRLAGGQEIAQSGNDVTTRLYAGGIVQPETLQELGITEQHILDYLKTILSTIAHKTRLHEPVKPEADGDWQYEYKILKQYPELPLSIGVETIAYKNENVFVHVFLNSPII